jgi:pyridoxal phosphate-dependent aminotransferase EpsN
MVLARDPESLRRMRKWANQSREPAIEYVHLEMGYNYRMSNVLAGIGRGQLMVLSDRVDARRAVAQRYREGLADIPGVSLQAEAPWGSHSRWLSVIYLEHGTTACRPVDVVKALECENIETRPVWRPMHTQPLFHSAQRVGGTVAESLYATGLCLPSSSSLTDAEQSVVIDALRATLSRSRHSQ